MKVIHLTFADNGGGHNAVYRIHHALLKQKINSRMWVNQSKLSDCTVEIFSKTDGVFCNFRRDLINYTIVKTLKTKNKIIHSPSILPSGWVKHINNSNADIVHLHWVQGEMLSIKDISKIKKPIVWTLHDMWAFCGAEHYTNDNRWREGYNYNNRPSYESGFDLNRWTWQRKKNYWKKPFKVVTPSNWLTNCVRESKLMNNWSVSTIPNPIDTDSWKPMDKIVARKKFNLSPDTSLILFGAMHGGHDPRKGVDLLFESLKNLKYSLKDKKIEVVVFGQNRANKPYKTRFPIQYIGHLKDDISLQAAYSAADVMVVPSRQDNLPNTAVEAQACGTPVVAFNIGGIPDIIIHKKTGYLAKAFDPKDLANGINFILKKNDSVELIKNSRDQAIKIFSEKKIVKSYLSIYKKLLSELN